jgi:hypothetical protein
VYYYCDIEEETINLTMSANEVANAFVSHYYQTFDSNVDNLAPLFVRTRMN